MPQIKRDQQQRQRIWPFVVVLVLCNDLLMYLLLSDPGSSEYAVLPASLDNNDYILAPPKGKAKALPSIREESPSFSRNQYGGAGDKKHLGGFTDIDTQGISPRAWKWMVNRLNIQSVLDVGCGRGISTTWFLFHGLDILCLEGSHDAVEKTMLPSPETQLVEHDFSRGPYWPEKTYDAVWCVEFLEHVGRDFHQNYLPAFRKAGLIFVTHSLWGGWHHVEVHNAKWWKEKMMGYGFQYLDEISMELRTLVWNETRDYANKGLAPNGKPIGAPHIHAKMQVYLNPAVTALPKHHHLFYEPGCYLSRKSDREILTRDCGVGEEGKLETPLPPEYKPLELTKEQDKKWFEWVKARVNPWDGKS